MTKLDNVDITVLCKKGGLKDNLPNLFKFFKLYATSSVVFVDDYYHFLSYIKRKMMLNSFSFGTRAVRLKLLAFQGLGVTVIFAKARRTTGNMIMLL